MAIEGDPFWGTAEHRGAWAKVKVKGSLVAARRRYLEESGRPEALEQCLETLTGEAHKALKDPPLPGAWVPLDPMAHIDHAIVEHLMRGDIGSMRAFGRNIADYDLRRLYRGLMRMVGEGWVMRGLPVAWRLYIGGGKIELDELDRTAQTATMGLRGAVLPRYLCQFGITGWVEASLAIAGSPDARVEHHCVHDGRDHCAWEVRWPRTS